VLDRPAEEGGGLTDAIIYVVRAGGAWTAPESIFAQDRPAFSDTSSPLSSDAAASNPAFALHGSAASARDGKLHLAIGDLNAQWYLAAPWDEVVRMANLLPPFALGRGSESVLVGAANGALHVALTAIPRGQEGAIPDGATRCDTCLEIVFRRSDDGVVWTRPENLSRRDGQDSNPQLGADDEGRVHLLWAHQGLGLPDEPAYLLYARSADGGLSWAEPQQLGAPGEASLHAVLGVGQGGRLLAVFSGVSTGSVFFQSSADGGLSWSTPGLVPGVLSPGISATGGRRFALAVDGAGRFHLLMVGALPADSGSGSQLLQLSWDGQSWSAPAALASGGAEPGNPYLAVERGRLLHC
jgi:hypothetical protein